MMNKVLFFLISIFLSVNLIYAPCADDESCANARTSFDEGNPPSSAQFQELKNPTLQDLEKLKPAKVDDVNRLTSTEQKKYFQNDPKRLKENGMLAHLMKSNYGLETFTIEGVGLEITTFNSDTITTSTGQNFDVVSVISKGYGIKVVGDEFKLIPPEGQGEITFEKTQVTKNEDGTLNFNVKKDGYLEIPTTLKNFDGEVIFEVGSFGLLPNGYIVNALEDSVPVSFIDKITTIDFMKSRETSNYILCSENGCAARGYGFQLTYNLEGYENRVVMGKDSFLNNVFGDGVVSKAVLLNDRVELAGFIRYQRGDSEFIVEGSDFMSKLAFNEEQFPFQDESRPYGIWNDKDLRQEFNIFGRKTVSGKELIEGVVVSMSEFVDRLRNNPEQREAIDREIAWFKSQVDKYEEGTQAGVIARAFSLVTDELQTVLNGREMPTSYSEIPDFLKGYVSESTFNALPNLPFGTMTLAPLLATLPQNELLSELTGSIEPSQEAVDFLLQAGDRMVNLNEQVGATKFIREGIDGKGLVINNRDVLDKVKSFLPMIPEIPDSFIGSSTLDVFFGKDNTYPDLFISHSTQRNEDEVRPLPDGTPYDLLVAPNLAMAFSVDEESEALILKTGGVRVKYNGATNNDEDTPIDIYETKFMAEGLKACIEDTSNFIVDMVNPCISANDVISSFN